jgi:hypothetical protein
MFSDNILKDYICGLSFVECWNDGRIMSLNLSGMGLQGFFSLDAFSSAEA